jgi:signal transduction histidine kinase
MALFMGGLIAALPTGFIFLYPGQGLTRYTIGVSQALFSALLIHLTGGRIEAHFHVFGSLAFLAFYRDWGVIVVSSAVVAVDHLVRGIYWPESVYGISGMVLTRTLEHAGWVIFEDIFLIYGCVKSTEEMHSHAKLQSKTELINASIEELVVKRTEEVQQRSQELEIAYHQLEGEVIERQKGEVLLQQYSQKLERSNRELQDFAHVASHDLQEPLRKVQAFGDRLATKFKEQLNDEARGYIQRMQNATSRMQTLINDLLTFSRVSSKTQPFAKVDLNKITSEVIEDLEVRIQQKSATVEVKDMPVVEADPTQMRQLLQNLIGNALKFQAEGVTPSVKVYGEQVSDDLNERVEGNLSFIEDSMTAFDGDNRDGFKIRYCNIVVEDNGIGFDEKYVDRIFTVFQRLHGRSEFEGSGIGLAVCRKIAERHHGSITAHSAPGKGAKFIITLPLLQKEVSA